MTSQTRNNYDKWLSYWNDCVSVAVKKSLLELQIWDRKHLTSHLKRFSSPWSTLKKHLDFNYVRHCKAEILLKQDTDLKVVERKFYSKEQNSHVFLRINFLILFYSHNYSRVDSSIWLCKNNIQNPLKRNSSSLLLQQEAWRFNGSGWKRVVGFVWIRVEE